MLACNLLSSFLGVRLERHQKLRTLLMFLVFYMTTAFVHRLSVLEFSSKTILFLHLTVSSSLIFALWFTNNIRNQCLVNKSISLEPIENLPDTHTETTRNFFIINRKVRVNNRSRSFFIGLMSNFLINLIDELSALEVSFLLLTNALTIYLFHEVMNNTTGILAKLHFFHLFSLTTATISVLKTPQPDSFSDTHGFRRHSRWNRMIYMLILLTVQYIVWNQMRIERFPEEFNPHTLHLALIFVIGSISTMMMCFLPFNFAFGSLPDIKVLAISTLEYLNMNLFSASPVIKVWMSLYTFAVSLFTSGTIYIIWTHSTIDAQEKELSTCGLIFFVVPVFLVAYLLSKVSHNINFFSFFKTHLRFCMDRFGVFLKFKDPISNQNTNSVPCRTKCKSLMTQLIGISIYTFCISWIPLPHSIMLENYFSISIFIFSYIYYDLCDQRRSLLALKISNSLTKFGVDVTIPHGVWQNVDGLISNVYHILFIISLRCTQSLIKDDHYILAAFIACICLQKCFRLNYTSRRNLHYKIAVCRILQYLFDENNSVYSPLIFYIILGETIFNFTCEFNRKGRLMLANLVHYIKMVSVSRQFLLASLYAIEIQLVQIFISCLFKMPIFTLYDTFFVVMSHTRPFSYFSDSFVTEHLNLNLEEVFKTFFTKNVPFGDYDAILYELLSDGLRKRLADDVDRNESLCIENGSFFIFRAYNLTAIVHILEVGDGFVSFQLRGLESTGTLCQNLELNSLDSSISPLECLEGSLKDQIKLLYGTSSSFNCWKKLSIKYSLDLPHTRTILLKDILNMKCTLDNFMFEILMSFIYHCYNNKNDNMFTKEIMTSIEKMNSRAKVLLDECKYYHKVMRKLHNYEVFKEKLLPWIKIINGAIQREIPQNELETHLNFFYKFYEMANLCIRSDIMPYLFTSSMSIEEIEVIQPGWSNEKYAYHILKFFYKQHIWDKPYSKNKIVDSKIKNILCLTVRNALVLQEEYFIEFKSISDEYRLIQLKNINEQYLFSHELTEEWRDEVRKRGKILYGFREIRQPDTSSLLYVVECRFQQIEFSVFEVNPECVRSMWANQQFELIFGQTLENERFSVQQSKRILRNIFSSSLDPPCGYPSYVSPYITSYASTDENSGNWGKYFIQFCMLEFRKLQDLYQSF